jgi:hypothetical protein
VVTLLSLSSMVLNHLVLPIAQPSPDYNLYHWLVWVRRLLLFVLWVFLMLFMVCLPLNTP